MKLFFEILGFIWALPATILCWSFYILPLVLSKEIKYVGKLSIFTWEFSNPIDPTSCYDSLWNGWGGWSGPCVVILHENIYKDPKRLAIIRKHEGKHCEDQLMWGALFYPAYILSSAWILISNTWKKDEDKKNIYYFNSFEIAARKAAGQVIDVSRKTWIDGPKDYNPWV